MRSFMSPVPCPRPLGRLSARALTALLPFALAVMGCDTTVPTSLQIVTPESAANIKLGTDMDRSVDVKVRVQGFTLRKPGQCQRMAACGHIRVKIDGDACNDGQNPYNNLAWTTGMQAHFRFCISPTGPHSIEVALYDDDNQPVPSEGTAQTSGRVAVTTMN